MAVFCDLEQPLYTSNVLCVLEEQRNKQLRRNSVRNVVEIDHSPSLVLTITESERNDIEFEQADIVFKNGHSYKGQTHRHYGLPHGVGEYAWSNGVTYKGEFNLGNITGQGLYQWQDGSSYEGGVLNGLKHGHGVYTHPNGYTHYAGEWSHGLRHGKGKLVYDREGLSYYHGEWIGNRQTGHGHRRYSNGNWYEGEWQDCVRHGTGTMYWTDTNERYTGEWRNGHQHGQGEHMWLLTQTDNSQFPLHNRYVGGWKEGRREGQGIFYYASGSVYDGNWVNDKKEGHGRYTLPNGHIIEGTYKNDKLVSKTTSSVDRPATPLGSLIGDIDGRRGSTTQLFNLQVLKLLSANESQEEELKQVHCIILRYITQLKKAYHVYSSLGGAVDDDSKHRLKTINRLQLWQLLKDCKIHTLGLTLAQINSTIAQIDDINTCSATSHSPSRSYLMREFLQCLVYVAAYIVRSRPMPDSDGVSYCFNQFMKKQFLPNACRINGMLYKSHDHTAVVERYLPTLWGVYQGLYHKYSGPPTFRQLLYFMKEHNIIGGYISATDVVKIFTSIQPLCRDNDDYNLQHQTVYLEFVEVLIRSALLWYKEDERERQLNRQKTEQQEQPVIEEEEHIKDQLSSAEVQNPVIRVVSVDDDIQEDCDEAKNIFTDDIISNDVVAHDIITDNDLETEEEPPLVVVEDTTCSSSSDRASTSSSTTSELELWRISLERFFNTTLSQYL